MKRTINVALILYGLVNNVFVPGWYALRGVCWCNRLWLEFHQRCCLVCNLAGVLGDPVKLAEVLKTVLGSTRERVPSASTI
jgi:hypothetical protein